MFNNLITYLWLLAEKCPFPTVSDSELLTAAKVNVIKIAATGNRNSKSCFIKHNKNGALLFDLLSECHWVKGRHWEKYWLFFIRTAVTFHLVNIQCTAIVCSKEVHFRVAVRLSNAHFFEKRHSIWLTSFWHSIILQFALRFLFCWIIWLNKLYIFYYLLPKNCYHVAVVIKWKENISFLNRFIELKPNANAYLVNWKPADDSLEPDLPNYNYW